MDGTKDQPEVTLSSEGSSSGGYAFLNHSASTLPNKLPPRIDDKSLARQKRKRTSPEDQAVLEAAYNRDPKPDKNARLNLVNRVALGEKEVQIWFQNRRQSSRRKSRPLLPHEIAQYQLSRSASSDQGPPSVLESSFSDDELIQQHEARDEEAENLPTDEPHRPSTGPSTGPSSGLQPDDRTGNFAPPSSDARPSEEDAALQTTHQAGPEVEIAKNAVDLLSSSPGYLSNRRSAPLHQIPPPPPENTSTDLPNSQTQTRRPLRKSTSAVRLSLNSEGNATVVTKDSSSPSSPRPSQSSRWSFGSAANTSPDTLATSQSSNTAALHRTPSGRSRDSRAWEFWCDKDSRSALSTQASADASGSATGAIGLLRSASGRRNVLGSVPSRRNPTLPTSRSALGAPPQKRSRLDDPVAPTRPELPRSFSSGPVYTYSINSYNKTGAKPNKRPARKSKFGDDSDKENRSPDEDDGEADDDTAAGRALAAARRRMAELRRARRTGVPRAARPKKRGSDVLEDGEGEDSEADPEVAAFMAGEGSREGDRRKAGTPGEEDMDCVQGLLSLSQGNWR